MLTRGKIRKVRRRADEWYRCGVYWDRNEVPAPPAGPFRIAFDAGRRAATRTRPPRFAARSMSAKVWAQVLAEWLGD